MVFFEWNNLSIRMAFVQFIPQLVGAIRRIVVCWFLALWELARNRARKQ